jgi:hypothetical protein
MAKKANIYQQLSVHFSLTSLQPIRHRHHRKAQTNIWRYHFNEEREKKKGEEK